MCVYVRVSERGGESERVKEKDGLCVCMRDRERKRV